MKNNKMILAMTAVLIAVAALLLTGSLALLTSVADEETPLPQDLGMPYLSAVETPVSAERLIDEVNVTETNGKRVAHIFSEAYLASIAERRENGEWLTLSVNEMLSVINDTVALFYDSHIIELGVWNDGVYSVQSYYGYLYYTSDSYTKTESSKAPDAEKDIFDIILRRVQTLHDGIAVYDSFSLESSEPMDSVYAFASIPRTEQKTLEYLCYGMGHCYNTSGQDIVYDCLLFHPYNARIELVEHASENMRGGVSDTDSPLTASACHTKTTVFYNERIARDFVTTVEAEGVRRVRVGIYDEQTHALVSSFAITDQAAVNQIFEGFFTAFDNACKSFEAHITSDEERAYRGKYRIIAYFEMTYENITDEDTRIIDICYPYGYSNDIYGYLHDDPWMDYQIKGGSAFIELIDSYVDAYIPAE